MKISDIADVSYIPLETENVLFGSSVTPRQLFVCGDKIFIGDPYAPNPKLVVYDRTGTFVQILGSYGRGPGEYLSIGGFVVDTLTGKVTIYDNLQGKLIVYDIDGKFRHERKLREIYENQAEFSSIELISDDRLLAFNGYSLLVAKEDIQRPDGRYIARAGQAYNRGKTLMIIDNRTLSELPFSGFEYANPGTFMVFTIFSHLTTQREGVYLTSVRSDTIYFMNRNLEVVPKFRDITNYGSSGFEARLFPAAETERYVLFSTELGQQEDNNIARRFFAYDKKSEKLFRLNSDLPEKNLEYFSQEYFMINDQLALTQFSLTLNHNYASRLFSPLFLLEHYNRLPKELKEITKSLKEDDNPVLMLIKFK
ncbi:MAG: 6-bladed beta-propeller [Bacteroidales bacterium]|nr:6-bladed beta-propeller [Bacteroidales bacterium]